MENSFFQWIDSFIVFWKFSPFCLSLQKSRWNQMVIYSSVYSQKGQNFYSCFTTGKGCSARCFSSNGKSWSGIYLRIFLLHIHGKLFLSTSSFALKRAASRFMSEEVAKQTDYNVSTIASEMEKGNAVFIVLQFIQLCVFDGICGEIEVDVERVSSGGW